MHIFETFRKTCISSPVSLAWLKLFQKCARFSIRRFCFFFILTAWYLDCKLQYSDKNSYFSCDYCFSPKYFLGFWNVFAFVTRIHMMNLVVFIILFVSLPLYTDQNIQPKVHTHLKTSVFCRIRLSSQLNSYYLRVFLLMS